MQNKSVLSVTEVERILAAASAHAQQNQWPVAIAVVDDGGHPLALLRMNDCAPASAYIAMEKARTAALGRKPSKDYEDMINGGRTAFLSAPLVATLEGGVPIWVNGQAIGAVGVSGVKPGQDAEVAQAGVDSVVTNTP